MLAIVHFAAVGQRVGSGASAQVRTLFEQADAEARFSQRDGGGQPRQTAADHQNALRGHPSSTNRSLPPSGDIEFFPRWISETREENTSNSRSSIRASSVL